MRMVSAVLVLLWSMSASATDPEDVRKHILCDGPYADATEPIPAPFDQWVIVLCLPDGQALAPKVEKEGILWMHHRKGIPYMVTAIPQGLPRIPKSDTFDPRRDVRFSEFAGGKLSGEPLDLAKKYLEGAFDNGDEIAVDEVYELDARSVYRGLIYNMFFYLHDGLPRQLIVCLDRCGLAVPIDIRTLSELRSPE